MPYPVLSIKDLTAEPICISSPDHRSGQLILELEKKANIKLKNVIENNPMNRMQLADRRLQTVFIRLISESGYTYDTSRICMLKEEDDIPVKQVLAYLLKMKDSGKTSAVAEAFKSITDH